MSNVVFTDDEQSAEGSVPLCRLDILQTVRIDRRMLYTQVRDIGISARQI